MADVFISYAREDRDMARTVAKALESDACSVWWDRQLLGGDNFDEVIERELDHARSVIVLWSRHSVSSDWVRSEAAAAAERGVLVPAYIEVVKLPLQFRRKHTIDLTSWRGDANDPEFEPMRQAIAAHLRRELPLRTLSRSVADRVPQRRQYVLAAAIAFGISVLIGAYYLFERFTRPESPAQVAEEQLSESMANASNPFSVESPGYTTELEEEVQATGRYSLDQCGAIKDSRSRLEWYVGDDRTVSWYEARDWIQSLQVCAGGWRMPTTNELKALYDPSQKAGVGYLAGGKRWPAHIDPIFDIGEGSWVWAASEPTNGTAKSFNFNQGAEVSYSPTNMEYTTRAFAVREAG